MRKKIVLGGILIILVSVSYLLYQYNRKPANTRLQQPAVEITANDLAADFNDNEAQANQKYTDKIILVTGSVLQIQTETTGEATVFLKTDHFGTFVSCSFYDDEAPKVATLKPGEEVSIQGVCTGKLMDVVLNKCSLQ